MANEKVLQAVIKLKDNISKPLKGIVGELNGVSKKCTEVGKSVKDMSEKMGSASKKMIGVGTALSGAMVGVTTSFTNQATEIAKISKMANTTTTEYQKFDKIMKSTGYSMEQANGDFAAMGERMAVTQQELSGLLESESDLTLITKGLGLSVTDSNGKLKSTGKFMNELISATSKLSNKTHQQALMTALLSTTGEELLPHLDDWDKKFSSISEKDLISEEQINKAQQFKDKFNELKNSIGLTVAEVGSALIPILENLITKVNPVVQKFTDWAKENPKLIQSLLEIGGVVAVVGAVLFGLSLVVSAVGTAMTVFGFLCSPIGLILLGVIVVINTFTLVFKAMGTSWGEVWQTMKTKFDNFINPIKESLSAFGDWCSEQWAKVTGIFSKPINANVSVGSSGGRSAYGTKRVAKNDTPYRLHEGERVLTKQQANQMDSATLGNSNISINISNMTIREEADIDRVARALVKKINQNKSVFV